MKIKIGLPKGSLQEATFKYFANAGFHFSTNTRSYFSSVDDDELEGILLRAQEIGLKAAEKRKDKDGKEKPAPEMRAFVLGDARDSAGTEGTRIPVDLEEFRQAIHNIHDVSAR